jgi:excisionase family DNA binding protein
MNTLNSPSNVLDKKFEKRLVIEYLTREEAARYLRCSVSWLDHKAADGEIPYYKLGNGRTSKVLYKVEDLKKCIEKRRVEI